MSVLSGARIPRLFVADFVAQRLPGYAEYPPSAQDGVTGRFIRDISRPIRDEGLCRLLVIHEQALRQ